MGKIRWEVRDRQTDGPGLRFAGWRSGCCQSMLRLGGAAALSRARQRREAAEAAQTARVEAEKAAIAKAHEAANERGHLPS